MTEDEYNIYLTDRRNHIMKALAEYVGTDIMTVIKLQAQLDYIMKELYELDKCY